MTPATAAPPASPHLNPKMYSAAYVAPTPSVLEVQQSGLCLVFGTPTPNRSRCTGGCFILVLVGMLYRVDETKRSADA